VGGGQVTRGSGAGVRGQVAGLGRTKGQPKDKGWGQANLH